MKYAIFLISLTLIFAASACTDNPVPPDNENDYREGFDGVEFEFMDNRPPDKIFEEDEVPLMILLHNKGAQIISEEKPVVMTLSYDPLYFSFKGAEAAEADGTNNYAFSRELRGRSKYYPLGELADQTYVGVLRANTLLGQIQSPETELFLNLCYPYKTIFYDVVCVNSDFYYDEERQEICKSEEMVDNDGQGAPITITKVVPRISLVEDTSGPHEYDGVVIDSAHQVVKPVFEIYIENKNNGAPYSYAGEESTDFCLGKKVNNVVPKKLINKVILNASLNPGENTPGTLNCGTAQESHAVVTLIDGKGIVYCKLPNEGTITADYNYLAPLIVEMNYIYSEGGSKEVEVIRKFR